MNIRDDSEIDICNDMTVFHTSMKDLCSYIARSKVFRKELLKHLIEDGAIPAQGD